MSLISTITSYFDYYYTLLLIAILAISTSGVALKRLYLTPPILKAFWRLFLHSIVMIPPCIYQLKQMNTEDLNKYYSKQTWITLFISGISLAIHFGTWIASLNMTSLAHSFVLVSCSPLIVIIYMKIIGKSVSWYEIIATFIGFVGLAIMTIDLYTGSDNSVTVLGDILAFVGAISFVIYIMAGKELRSWVPIFPYSLPVTFIGAVLLLIVSNIFEDVSWTTFDSNAIFGLFNPVGPYFAFLFVLAIVIGPGSRAHSLFLYITGIMGHTFINIVLSRISPLIVSVACTTEPVFGVLFGVLVGVSDVPGSYTMLGGLITIIATVFNCFIDIFHSQVSTIYATHIRETSEAALENIIETPVEIERLDYSSINTIEMTESKIEII